VSSAYLEDWLDVEMNGTVVRALSYVIDPDHDQYCGDLTLDAQAQIIAAAVGGRGRNCEYLFNTAAHLAQLGIADADLDWLCDRVRGLRA
jgi:cation transport protein ChaC